MLKLENIHKDYVTGDEKVEALRGVSLQFRASEFVSVLGPSGCGKTTLLNIIGGLDQYTQGDLIINGRSTKQFRDRDWDSYRNHSVGFVFQSYNLIPHQSVLANVELALTLSGVSRAERRRRAAAALEKVGLGDQLRKRPNQMSGGQMQRVAIARALVNEPSILLADEPTGALDTETSVQIMELLKEISRDRLVIMVTHNPELAAQYSTRIIRLLDGRITDDSAPCTAEEAAAAENAGTGKAPAAPVVRKTTKEEKTSMGMGTALALSLNNLLTKKARTVLTAFAGSIGIIGIALILSLSNGIQNYIDRVQEDTLASYPITIQAETVDMSSLVTGLMGAQAPAEGDAPRDESLVYSSTVMYDMLNAMTNAETQTNDLQAFKKFIDTDEELRSHLSAVQYTYHAGLEIYTADTDGKVIRSDIQSLMETVYGDMMAGNAYAQQSAGFANMQLWEQMLPGEDGPVNELLYDQYDLLYGAWPTAENEVVLFVNEHNELSDLVLYALGLKSGDELSAVVEASMKQEPIPEQKAQSFTFEELCGKKFKVLLPADCWQYDAAAGTWHDLRTTETGLKMLYESSDTGIELKITGILRPNEDAASAMMGGAIGYTAALMQRVMAETEQAEIVKAQLEQPETDVFSGLPFRTADTVEPADAEKAQVYRERAAGLSVSEKAEQYAALQAIPDESYVQGMVQQSMAGLTRADIETQLKQAYAAEMEVDASALDSYIAEMDDETLFGYVEQMIAENIRAQYAEGVAAQLAAMTDAQLAAAFDARSGETGPAAVGMEPYTEEQWVWLYDNYMPPTHAEGSSEENLKLLGWADPESPAAVDLYAATFADKDAIAAAIERYNAGVESEEDEITYTDYVALLMSSITTIINAISYVLIAFVAISLVVSSIMIGIITYISVLERTKEIGILRAIGASKRDVSRVFNAETLIVGFVSGAFGIGLTVVLNFPINALVQHLTGIESLRSVLPPAAALILVGISMLLTVIAGLFPSRIAAKKDPVVALRSE
ncbi:MAG: ABC transporter ATP-binding protein/permease [Oscillospiraceae bacterium]|nr:ABC transporter ATP-binding protein/permease [Oscillospiraceae bacterium]